MTRQHLIRNHDQHTLSPIKSTRSHLFRQWWPVFTHSFIHDPSSTSLVIMTRLHHILLSWPVYTISGNHDPLTLPPIISSSLHLFRQSTPVYTLSTHSVIAHCLRCFAKPLLALQRLWARRGKGKIGNYCFEPLISTKKWPKSKLSTIITNKVIMWYFLKRCYYINPPCEAISKPKSKKIYQLFFLENVF